LKLYLNLKYLKNLQEDFIEADITRFGGDYQDRAFIKAKKAGVQSLNRLELPSPKPAETGFSHCPWDLNN
jgi:hypothetical protein